VAKLLALTLVQVSMAQPACAWVYPEHRDISLLAVETLEPERRAMFERLWDDARAGHDARLCAGAVDPKQGLKPGCIDWAAMPAIAGDHSCSGAELLDTIDNSEWILTVADIAAHYKLDLSRISNTVPEPASSDTSRIANLERQLESEALRAERLNVIRGADVRLQRADRQYAIRAGSNNAHFLLARPRPDSTLQEYLELTLEPGSEISAAGVFAMYHFSALQKAARLAREDLTPDQRSALALAVLTDEAFALHFLEDMFAAGHVAGTWGDVSQRKGTHDYYNEHGLEVTTWRPGGHIVLMGDAHMRSEDAERTAAVVRLSLEQILDVAADRSQRILPGRVANAPDSPETFQICRNNRMAARPEGQKATSEVLELAIEVLALTPEPSLGRGLGAQPRFEAEIGPFVGVAGSLDARYIDRGFTGLGSGSGLMGGADLSLRAGYGLEGVLGDAGDGLIYLSVGYRGDTSSTNKFSVNPGAESGGNLTAAIPARSGLSTRVRMPFYLVPGDLLLLSPLYFVAPSSYEQMAVTAVNGGLIPWQLGWETRVGRLQFVLGRELGVAFYGLQQYDTLLAPGATPGTGVRVLQFKSTSFDFPILEFRPYRAFDQSQSSEIALQLYFGMDLPRGGQAIAPPGAPGVELQPVYSVGLRIVFDWRRYFTAHDSR
jgi:hypothetical protein